MKAEFQHEANQADFSCQEFLEGHTDYVDGVLPDPAIRYFDDHVRSCASCQRYDHVVRRGILLARNTPDILPSPQFHERLQARLMLVDAEPVLPQPIVASPATVMVIAAVLAVIALAPVVRLIERDRMVLPDPSAAPAPAAHLDIAPFTDPALETPGLVRSATEAVAIRPAGFSPVVVTPPVLQTSPIAPRFISSPQPQQVNFAPR